MSEFRLTTFLYWNVPMRTLVNVHWMKVRVSHMQRTPVDQVICTGQRDDRPPNPGTTGIWWPVQARALIAVFLMSICASVSAQAPPSSTGLYYVAEYIVVTVRATPSPEAPSVTTVTSGQAVVVLEVSDISGQPDSPSPASARTARVRLDDGSTGWIQMQYLTPDRPAGLQLADLQEELEIMHIEREQLKQTVHALKLAATDLDAVLDKSKTNHARDRTHLLDLQHEHELLKQRAAAPVAAVSTGVPSTTRSRSNDEIREENRLLHIRNRELAERRQQTWFVIGGVICVVGVLLGLLATRIATARGRSW
ncbi:MAG: SH3 domain protein [Gammaproteobacteria bacterium]|jgi:SH3 domain protein